ncbi:MAG: hypothetical protein D3904_11900 [Candidatus Electrothrix sp. EH2]|nr:hypothetical protein [Candidatus Electrothrix sp. EH2]
MHAGELGAAISDVIVAYGNRRGNPEKVLPKISGMLIAKGSAGWAGACCEDFLLPTCRAMPQTYDISVCVAEAL